MKKTIQLLCAILAASIYTSSAHASCTDGTGCLQVPGDFSNPINNFSMYLLGGQFNIEGPDGNDGWWGFGGVTSLNTSGKQINFTATQFDHNGLGQGTSILSATLNHYVIGSADFLGMLASIYIDGTSTGSLVDNGDGTGHWVLNTHMYADWGQNSGIDLGVMPLSTNAAYSYNAEICDIDYYCYQSNHTAVGSAMNYYTGLAYMAGQGIIQNGPFASFRVTLGLQGQDPLSAPANVPVPAAAWLLGSGLIGLVGFARKRKTS